MAHVAEWKKKEVEELANLIKSYPVIALVNVADVPAYPLSKMRETLKEQGVLRVSRNTLIDLAIKKAAQDIGKPELEELARHIQGGAAILATNINPFKLYKFLQDSKKPAPAKPGAVVNKDVVIPAGPTSLAPGPVVGEMQALGIPARIEKGKVSIQKETVETYGHFHFGSTWIVLGLCGVMKSIRYITTRKLSLAHSWFMIIKLQTPTKK